MEAFGGRPMRAPLGCRSRRRARARRSTIRPSPGTCSSGARAGFKRARTTASPGRRRHTHARPRSSTLNDSVGEQRPLPRHAVATVRAVLGRVRDGPPVVGTPEPADGGRRLVPLLRCRPGDLVLEQLQGGILASVHGAVTRTTSTARPNRHRSTRTSRIGTPLCCETYCTISVFRVAGDIEGSIWVFHQSPSRVRTAYSRRSISFPIGLRTRPAVTMSSIRSNDSDVSRTPKNGLTTIACGVTYTYQLADDLP